MELLEYHYLWILDPQHPNAQRLIVPPHTDMTGVQFMGLVLDYVVFDYVDLRGASFIQCFLAHASFKGARRKAVPVPRSTKGLKLVGISMKRWNRDRPTKTPRLTKNGKTFAWNYSTKYTDCIRKRFTRPLVKRRLRLLKNHVNNRIQQILGRGLSSYTMCQLNYKPPIRIEDMI